MEDINVNDFSTEEEHGSAIIMNLKKNKDELKEEVSERKKGLKQDWIIKCLKGNN